MSAVGSSLSNSTSGTHTSYGTSDQHTSFEDVRIHEVVVNVLEEDKHKKTVDDDAVAVFCGLFSIAACCCFFCWPCVIAKGGKDCAERVCQWATSRFFLDSNSEDEGSYSETESS